MTAQEIFEECGYLVWFCRHPHSLPIVVEESMDDAIIEPGTKMVLIEEITKAEAVEYWKKYGNAPMANWPRFFYKAVAE